MQGHSSSAPCRNSLWTVLMSVGRHREEKNQEVLICKNRIERNKNSLFTWNLLNSQLQWCEWTCDNYLWLARNTYLFCFNEIIWNAEEAGVFGHLNLTVSKSKPLSIQTFLKGDSEIREIGKKNIWSKRNLFWIMDFVFSVVLNLLKNWTEVQSSHTFPPSDTQFSPFFTFLH